MQIEKLTMNNFRGIEHAEFIPEKVNLFIGKNGVGKTSHLEAMRFGLTGEAPDDILKNGHESGSVTLSVFGGTEIERSFGKKKTVKIAGKTSTQKSVKQFIEDNAGVNTETMEIVTMGTVIAGMNAGEISKFLVESGLIPVNIDFNKFLELCPVSKKAEEELHIMLPSAPIKFDIPVISEAYEYFFMQRSATKKALDVARKKSVFEGDVPTMTMSAVDKHLAEISARKQEKILHDKMMFAYEKAVGEHKKRAEEIRKLETEIKMRKVEKPDESIKKALEAKISQNEAEMHKEQQTLAVLNANISMFEKSLQNLDTTVCPLSNKLVCTTDKTQAKKEITELLQKNQSEQASLAEKISFAKERIQRLKNQIDEYNQNEEAYRSTQMLYDKLRKLRDNVPDIPEKPKELPSLEEDTKRALELTVVRNSIIAYELALKAKEESSELEKKLAVYEEIVKALNPKGGILEKIIAFALEPLVIHCNAKAKELKMDMEIAVRVDNGVHLLVKTSAESGYIGIKSASSGERLLATFLITDMLNSLSGFKFLILDDLDKLDADNLEALIALIMKKEVLADYDHIILSAVNHADTIETFKKHPEIQTICI